MNFMQKNNDLAGKEFWDTYWDQLKLPSIVNENFSFDRCLSRVLRKRLEEFVSSKGAIGKKAVLEIGAAPGKWLAQFPSDRFTVSGLESSQKGLKVLRLNLELLRIKPWKLIEEDFFIVQPSPIFDVVLSLGFVEHFEDPLEVIRRHLDWLKPDGILLVGVPNFTGLHRLFQKMLDSDVLAKHNTAIMNRSFFKGVERALGVQQLSYDYLGSFEPALPMTYKKITLANALVRVILAGASFIRRWHFWDCLNSSIFSSYILTIFRKTPLR